MANKTDGSDDAHDRQRSGQGENRRGFLRQLCAGAVAAAGSHVAETSARAEQAPTTKLPTIKLGKFTVTRLVAGGNPVGAYSHSTQNLAKHMREYFTQERTTEFAQRCVKAGINTWQTHYSAKIGKALRTLRERGTPLQWICLTSDLPSESPLKDVLALKPIAIVHHGGVTDTRFRLDRHQEVRDFVKKVHDAGVMAGVSSHNPANIAHIEEKGWENEFFMTCFYNVLRSGKDIRAKLGSELLGEPFLKSDPEQMTSVMQQVKRPCLGFKILAAGRLCWTEHSVQAAFRFAFDRIKKTDGVIVGMYPKFSDEISYNAQLTQKYGMPA